MGFVHLHCHTQYSLLDGAIRIGDLIAATKSFGQEACAITDHGVMYGALEFHDKMRDAGLHPVLGCEVYVAPRDMEYKQPIPGEPRYYHLVLLAENDEGYKNLMRLVTASNTKGFYHKPRVDKKILQELGGGLIAMSACLQGEIPYWLLRGNETRAREAIEFYRTTFDGSFYLEIQSNGLDDQATVNPLIVEMAREFDLPVVATNDCHYLHREDSRAHEALLCIQTQKTIHDADRMQFDTDELFLKSPDEMARDFEWIPEAVTLTGEVAARCQVEVPKGQYFFPVLPTDDGLSLDDYITKRAREGLIERIAGQIPAEYTERLEEELGIIISMGFPDYFLIVADYIQYAKDHGIPVGPGRGSAAGSLVAYALRITDIDPIRWNLLFERFLNPERKSMPDIDVDFCQSRRDEVIEYVKNKYGAEYVSQITTFGNMKAKAVVRDVGRVLGMSFAEVNTIAKLIPNDLNMTLEQALAEEPKLRELIKKDAQVTRLMEIARALEGLSRHASVHAGGVVISDDKPMTDHVPLYVDKKGMLISQYDMKRLERVGLIKFDMLGLKTLTVIQTALDILTSQGIDLDISRIPVDDPATYRLIGEGDTSSVFQLESSGMRQMLRQLRPEKFEDIIAAVALYRPGPMDLIPSYVERRHGREEIEYPHELLAPILEETYGIIVYQEQVMQIAQRMGGYSLGKADLLRRAMGKKIAAEMAKHRAVFEEGAVAGGVPKATAAEIFSLMEKFASYGFNKSHAAAYALVAYQTAYLKAHHFAAFMAANLTLDLNNTDKVVKHIAECKDKGVAILSPDINESAWEFVTTAAGIRFGLGGIKNVGKGAVEVLLEERGRDGRYAGLQDFVRRINLSRVNRRVIESLIRCGAFDSLHANRRALFEALGPMIDDAQRAAKDRLSGQETLFSLDEFAGEDPHEIEIPAIPDWPKAEKLKMEKDGIGFYISGHPLDGFTNVIERFTTATTATLAENNGMVIVAGVLNDLNVTRTRKGETMSRASLEDLEGFVPIIFFPRTYAAFAELIACEEPLMVKAEVKHGEGEDEGGENAPVELVAQEVHALDQAEALMAHRVLVHVDQRAISGKIAAIKGAVSDFRGACPLRFVVETEQAVVNIDAGNDYKVSPSRDFLQRVRDLLGPARVEVQ